MTSLPKMFDPRAFRWALTLKLAVEEINNSTELLPNHSLGYEIFDSCAYPLTAQRASLAVMNGPNEAHKPTCSSASPLLAVIAESGSAESTIVSRVLQLFRIPMISYFSSCSCLSDRREFPNFFRVIPSDANQVKAIAKLLIHFNWTWIGIVRGDHVYGHSALHGLLQALEGTNVCVSYQEMLPLLYNSERGIEIIRVMNSSSARVVVVFSAQGELTPFLKDYMKLNITGIQWIASEALATASVFTGSEYYPFLGGMIGFGVREGYIPKLKEYLPTVNPQRYPSNILVQELWGVLYGCAPFSSSTQRTQLPLCTGQETLNKQHSAYINASNLRISYNIYKSVYAIAHSLHSLVSCKHGNGPFINSTCADSSNVYPWQVSYFSTCACLSDKAKYPTFFRTIPSDYYQAKALAFLVQQNGWTWIGVIYSDNDYGLNGITAFAKEVEAHGVCIAFVGKVLRTYPQSKILEAVELIKRSTVKVILAFAPERDIDPLMKEVVKQKIAGIQWIGTESWVTADSLSTPEMFEYFGGTIGFVVRKVAMPMLAPVLKDLHPYNNSGSAFATDFWEALVGCRPPLSN
ncbi:extracellular calcium-sensing receptor-like [Clarias magur]|uniref:Extracellular calcium-sensing receptor-like n=1 Tax=Clarias magur TaxID=1594786 RepID=A0A8J4TX24_CLAMG|nr:extracellular calcium-sensing receptor-like [Clarias magur]